MYGSGYEFISVPRQIHFSYVFESRYWIKLNSQQKHNICSKRQRKRIWKHFVWNLTYDMESRTNIPTNILYTRNVSQFAFDLFSHFENRIKLTKNRKANRVKLWRRTRIKNISLRFVVWWMKFCKRLFYPSLSLFRLLRFFYLVRNASNTQKWFIS